MVYSFVQVKTWKKNNIKDSKYNNQVTTEKFEDRHIGQGVPDDWGYGSLLPNQADVHADEGTKELVPLIARAGWHIIVITLAQSICFF